MSEVIGVGAQLAGYRITGTLGRGGMGYVYEAEHAVLGRKAALKTLLPDLVEDGDFRERFIAESQMVAAESLPVSSEISARNSSGRGWRALTDAYKSTSWSACTSPTTTW